MGSFKGNGQNQGSERRRQGREQRRRGALRVETLEGRVLLDGSGYSWKPTTTDLRDVKNGPMANLGQDFINLYQDFLKGVQPGQLQQAYPAVMFQGNMVGIQLKGLGDFTSFQTSLRNLGMNITGTSPKAFVVEGYVPVAALPTVAALPQLAGGLPMYKPIVKSVGAAINGGEQTMHADTVRTQFGLDGSGVKVGVLSDSVSQFQGGLAASVTTGDLPSTVQVLVDGPAGASDEGRAMLELIHDIAPGSPLAFATAATGQAAFGTNIVALANAGSQVIVDDIGYLLTPSFQDGLIAQGVNTAVASGASYFSAAGNSTDNGYLSRFRPVQTTVGSLGAGRYMNFAPSGAAVTQLPITVNSAIRIGFQYDDAYGLESLGQASATTTDMDIIVLDAGGAVVAQGNANNVATNAPFETLALNPGSYTVVIRLNSGADPRYVQFYRFANGPDNALVVSKQFGSAGETFYPSSWGQSTANNTIGVGAIPWWANQPGVNQNPLLNETYSSYGPAYYTRNPDGTLKSGSVSPTLNPVVTGPDASNTSFFIPGFFIDTSNPGPGLPSSPTNLNQSLFPVFTGTSAAAPNVAAVAALLKQRVPTLTADQIREGLKAGAVPLNGATAGTWDAKGGFGLVDARAALNAVDALRVLSTIPVNGATLTTTPNQILVTFNKPVDFSTVSSNNLRFQKVPVPPLTSMVVGTPIAVDDPKFPTQVSFPFAFTFDPTKGRANGDYSYKVTGGIRSQDGKTLTEYSAAFTLNDATAPRVVNTTVNNRVITVQFSEPMAASTVNKDTVYVVRELPGGGYQYLNSDPRFVFGYNKQTNTATLDYSGLNQVQLPAGRYSIVVLSGKPVAAPGTGFTLGATDAVGNPLDGEFGSSFPSGNGIAGGTFVQSLGNVALNPPIITSFELTNPSDTGIKGDSNTFVLSPSFVGQVASAFPGSVSNLTVYAQFSALHGGNLDLTTNGRGFTGNFDVSVQTDANGTFVINAPQLLEGFSRVKLVVVGQPDLPVQPGLASQFDKAFRIDTTSPYVQQGSLTVGGAALPTTSPGQALSGLTELHLNVVDPASPASGVFATPAQVIYPALNPTAASNISNYQLVRLGANNAEIPASQFIATAGFVTTASDFLSPPNRTAASDPYFGRVDLTFSAGLTSGNYIFRALGNRPNGLTDAAGNPLNNTGQGGQAGANFELRFNIQPVPVYVISVSADTANAQGDALLPRSYYSANARPTDIVSAPPTTFTIDLSNPLNPNASYANSVQLLRSANTIAGSSDGEFGTLGTGGLGSTGTGFTRVNPAGTTVTVENGPYGANTRLVLRLPAGTVLAPDYYRLYMPNSGANQIVDIFNNTLDGEFLGNPTANAKDLNQNPGYETLLPNGSYRAGMSGDAVSGGAFMTGFVVTSNLIYARPDYIEDPLLSSTTPDGSLAKPYPVLAPQAAANSLNNSTLNNGDPNGGLNSSVNFLSGFNSLYDRAGLGRFARSAFYAAAQLSSQGPVVIVALPGTPQRDPLTGVVTQQTFVLQAPAGADPIANDGSGSVPYGTTLVFAPGSSLKLQNAALLVQNQGSALQALGGSNPNDRVTFTSYSDDTVGGDTNRNGTDTKPLGGDWGGLVLRSYTQAGRSTTFPVDTTLRQGPNGAQAVSGADDVMSSINFANIRYGGGAVPATQGTRYDNITLYNSRPAVTNTSIIGGPSGNGLGSQASISGDLDSFREDDTARGPLIRRTTVSQGSINGIWIRPLTNTGNAVATDAVVYPNNPLSLGGARNYVLDDPLPYVLTSVLDIGTQNVTSNPGQNLNVRNRLYVQPGMMVKSTTGGGIRVLTPGASLIVGDRTYITRWDAQATIDPVNGLPTSPYGPADVGFRANTTGDARALFTTALDNTASTSFFDPVTQQTTIIVPAIDSLNSGGTLQPTPGNVAAAARWGRIQINSGTMGTIDEADIRYGGGNLNVPGGANGSPGVLQFTGASGSVIFIPGQGFVQQPGSGTRFSVTDNNIYDNRDVPMTITPNGLLAADTLRPLSSGHPFFRGNIFQRNLGANGLLVEGTNNGSRQASNVNVNSLWDHTDLTYIVRNTIVMGGTTGQNFGIPPTSYQQEARPSVVLTVQSALSGTLLANGQSIARPGESVIVKLDSRNQPAPDRTFTTTANITSEDSGGAGFISGVDNGVDPDTDSTIDVGAFSQMRFLGIGANETTGQQRVPAIITSINDNTVGTTVRGVKQFTAIDGNTTAPAAGDGGLIYFGGNGRTDYSLLDPRGGSLIDNADIRYIARIEMQGGGIINGVDLDASNSFDIADNPRSQKAGAFNTQQNGQPNPLNYQIQANSAHAMTISNSNLANFRDAGVFVHPGFNLLVLGVGTTPRSAMAGQANLLFMMNNTVANMPIAIQVVGDPNSDSSNAPEPTEVLLLHNTFYNNRVLIDAQAIAYAPGTPQVSAQIHLIGMNNIIDGSTTAVLQTAGMLDGSIFQYNLYNNSGPFQVQHPTNTTGVDVTIPNNNPINGDPQFRDPANGNFQLKSTSPAIDASRSELNLNPTTAPSNVSGLANISTTLLPVVDQVLDARGGIRNQTRRVSLSGGFGGGAQFDPTNPPTDQLTLPGTPNRGFIDLWVATLATDPQGVPGPTTVTGSWVYKPALIPPGTQGVPGGGQRDALGYLRIDNAGTPNVGFGSLPFFDIGAFEYRALFPPHITAALAVVADQNNNVSVTNLYNLGGVVGTNKDLRQIQIYLDKGIDPTTINGNTILLQGSGGDGIFGNQNSSSDRFYNLSGKLTFVASPNPTIVIDVSGLNLQLNSDLYRIQVLGSGSEVIRDPQGNALDGENTINGDINGALLPLPTGDGFPGGNFYLSFLVNTQSPSLVNRSFTLADSSDSNVIGDKITNNNKPTYTGQVVTPTSAIVPLAGQTAILDISTKGDGVFDRLNVGTALTDAQGRFNVTAGIDAANTKLVVDTSPIPDSPYNVGPDGILRPGGDDSGYTWARIRIIDQSGNSSNQIGDPVSAFVAKGALTGTVIDTAAPRITSLTPTPNSKLVPTGGLTFTFRTDKNIDPASVNNSSILLTRAGADGTLGTADDVNIAIAAQSFSVTNLGPGVNGKGPQEISFTVSGALPNDQYALTVRGSGATPLRDIAGNGLAGSFDGTFPTGKDGVAGVDFNPVYVVFDTTNNAIRFVGAATYVTNPAAAQGSRANPYPTITAGLAAASAGDVVGVLPGVYTESITLKPFVRVLSSTTASTATSFFVGNAQQTIIRAPDRTGGSTAANITVRGIDIPTVAGVNTELSGFSISSPLLVDPARGPIDPNAVGVYLQNSNVLLSRNYIVDAGIGVNVVTLGANANTPRLVSNGLIGNINGLILDDRGQTTSVQQVTTVNNNTFAFNTTGVQALNTIDSPLQAALNNNIFWQNHDTTVLRSGLAINSASINKLVARNNLFSGNGANDTSPSDDTINVGNGFDPTLLKATPDVLGNFTGAPNFVSPRDPRPSADGPAVFYLDANFDLKSNSAAIDAAGAANAPPVDFRYRGRVDIPNKGFPGTGPADVGAFEFQGSGLVSAASTASSSSAFQVASASFSTSGTSLPNGSSLNAQAPPDAVTVTFSSKVAQDSVDLTDLVLSGDGLNPVSPAKPTSLTWVDEQTVRFNLSSGFNSSGTVKLSVPAGSVRGEDLASNPGFSDTINLSPIAVSSPTVASPTLAPAVTPAPAAPPTTVGRNPGNRRRFRR